MKQLGLTDARLVKRSKKTRKAEFLEQMERIIPWSRLLALVEPHYPKPKRGRGRRPIPLETMLRIHLLQHFFNYSDPGMEEALYDVPLLREFARIDLVVDVVPDETTILKFRHLLERHGLAEINALLEARGLLLRRGTAVDATLIAAPPSTKNRARRRDPEMSSTKKGKQWHFGMKAHIGVDLDSKLVHTVVCTTAKVADARVIDRLLHGQERSVHGDRAYTSNSRHPLASDPRRGVLWCMPFKRPRGGEIDPEQAKINRLLARLRARVEPPFRVLKCQFGYTEVRYRGIDKNAAAITTKFALVNLYLVRRHLLAMAG